jgi:hypothetical protein
MLAALAAAAFVPGVSGATVEEETLERLAQIRAIKAEGDRSATDRYNKQLDEAWKFFGANKAVALPVLRRELALELKKDKPSQLVLLDIGYFIRLQQTASDKELAKQALFALDTHADIVRWNLQQLFLLSHAVASDRDPRTLAFLDKTFLRDQVTAFIPQHALTLDETLVCVFLYGVYGQGAETHLRPLMAEGKLTHKVIEILVWIGSPESIPEVKAAMAGNRDYETFARVTTFMMQVGGPQGRELMLQIDPRSLDAKSAEYYGKIRKAIERTSYEAMRAQFSKLPGERNLPDDELKKRLSAMYESYGKDDKTSPEAVVSSGLPSAFLIDQLTRIRSRMFYRLSDEALNDVEMTNALLNTLRYRGK